jgi:hypothetical protein
MLIVLDQVRHCLVGTRPYRLIIPLDMADSAPIGIPFLVMVAAMGTALTTRDLLPQFADLNRLPDIPAYLVAIEEVGCVYVIAPSIIAISLLYRVDVPNEVLEDRIAAVLGYQGIQVIEYLLDS